MVSTPGMLQKKTMWFIGVEVEQETIAPLPKKNPGSAPVHYSEYTWLPSKQTSQLNTHVAVGSSLF